MTGPKKSALPAKIAPELATLVDGPPSTGDDWMLEMKFDGYRMLRQKPGSAHLFEAANGVRTDNS
ncbi:hypothetical protein QTI17_31425 [Variovorax sp. J31P179]|uniref:hypothetical protein n=1 Tax=Variovorax sp. J31P179 TaxID=3053508 RepID=UPI002575C974|nr:hypothetical protein [Variovorax sp. J31P179]MDM0085107.1 hypothetical protein [Variovorax sp. J31P179]